MIEEDEPAPAASEVPPIETSLWPEIALPERFFGRDPITIGPAVIAAIVVGSVLAAFLVGLAIPRSRDTKPSADAMQQVRGGRLVRVERTGAGVRLRLDSFSQRGRRIVLRFTVPDQPRIDIGRITSIFAAPVVSGGLTLDGASLDVRNTVTGFVAEGEIAPRADLAVTGIRIFSLEMLTHGSGRAILDVSHVWGDQREGPLALDRVVNVRLSGREMRVVGMVGWPDHLEIQVEDRGVPGGWTFSDQYKILPGEAAPADGEEIRAVESGVSRFVTVGFHECAGLADRCLPRGISRAILTVNAQSATINGDWRWDFG